MLKRLRQLQELLQVLASDFDTQLTYLHRLGLTSQSFDELALALDDDIAFVELLEQSGQMSAQQARAIKAIENSLRA